MASSDCSVKQLTENQVEAIGKFVCDIRSGKLQSALKIALATISFLEQLISEAQNATAYELCGVLRATGGRIGRALPDDVVAANMVRRVLRAVRDEHRAAASQAGEGAGESLQRLVLATPSRRATVGPAEQDLREPIRDQIAELRAELESTEAALCAQARGLIDADEVVLCSGGCPLLEAFLRAAAQHRPYRLVVCEGESAGASHGMAARLSALTPVTVITNAAVFAVMSRVNKVVLSVRSAMGGGAVLAPAGAALLTSAAKHYNVQVLALAPLFALTPLHATDPQHTALASPLTQHTYEECSTAAVHVYAPRDEFLPPDHVTLFITNLGGSPPSYVYRLLSELYDPRDNILPC